MEKQQQNFCHRRFIKVTVFKILSPSCLYSTQFYVLHRDLKLQKSVLNVKYYSQMLNEFNL